MKNILHRLFFSPTDYKVQLLLELNLLDPASFKEEVALHTSRLKDLHMLSYLSEKAIIFLGNSLKCTGGYLLW